MKMKLLRLGYLISVLILSRSASAQMLTGSFSIPSGIQNLTTLGTADWAHWGLYSSTSFDHKANVLPQIGNYTVVNAEAGAVASYNGNPIGYTWTDGTPDSSISGTTTGVYVNGLNHGFQFSSPADTTTRTLTVFAGVYNGTGQLTAHLSDGSAADFIDTSLSSNGSQIGAYTLQYAAANAGQTLQVTWTLNAGAGNVNIQSAALAESGGGTVTQDFSATVQPSTESATAGGTANFTVAIASLNGFSGTVALAVTGLPQGATAGFSPSTISNGAGSSILTVTVPSNASPNSWPLTITGTSGALSHTATATLQITGPPDFTLSSQPVSQSVTAGNSTSFTVTVAPQNGFNSAVALSASGLPAATTATFVPATIPAGGGSSLLTVTTGSTTSSGSSSITITGTSGTLNHSTTATIIVSQPGSGTLTGAVSTPAGVQNLTTLGTADWAHWGLSSSTSFDHKSSGNSQIGNFTIVNGQAGSVASFGGSATTYSWTDGTPDTSVSGTSTGVYITGQTRGFQFTAPADTTARTLTVFLGVFAGQGQLTAHLSDGSAADFVDTSLSSGAGAYTLQYQAAATGQTLTITWTLVSGEGNVNLQAAALSAASSADFDLELLSSTMTTTSGNSASDTVTITPRNGFTDQVNLSVSGLPPNATATFTPPAITGGTGSSVLDITVAANTTPNSYPLTITGTTSSLSHGRTATLQVVGAADFTLSVQPASVTVLAGSTASYTVSISPLNGFTGSANLTISGLPSDAVYTFAPVTIAGGGGNASLAIAIPANEATSSYSPLITATSGAISHSVTATLQITGQDFSLGLGQTTQSISAGSSATYTVNITPQDGFTGAVALNVSGLPAASAATFTPATVNNGSGTSTLVVSVPTNAVTNTYSLLITATSGALSHSTTATLQVTGTPTFSLSLQSAFQSATEGGGNATYSVLTSPGGSYNGTVSLSVTGLPPGATTVWNTQTISGISGSANVIVSVPAGEPAGSYPLIFSATGGNLSQTTRGVLLITAGGGVVGPTLSGTVSSPAATQNLTASGTSDWAHWGLFSASSFDHKAGVTQQISNISVVNGEPGSVSSYGGNAVSYSWTDGTPDVSVSNTATGIYIGGLNNGFQIVVPADTTPRTVTLFVGVFSGQGQFVAHLSDGSAADFVDSSLAGQSAQSGEYTIQYCAASAGQTLTLTWTLISGSGNVNLQAAALSLAGATGGPQFYVSPNGNSSGDGSIGNPWDIVTAFNQPAAVQPGATIWLRGGTYASGATQFISNLAGTATAPIIVRQYPGERATIDGGVAIYGPYTWYWGFEVFSSSTDRGSGAPRLECMDTYTASTGVKLINLILHDCLQGLGFWSEAVNAEANGNLIYYNGEYSLARGVGHGIYTQNETGVKNVIDNIIFDQYDIGFQAYGSPDAFVQGYALDGNVVFNNGLLYGSLTDNVLFGASGSADQVDNISVQNTYAYSTPSLDQGESQLGWQFDGQNGTLTAQNNYWMGGNSAVELWNWTNATFTNNTNYSQDSLDMLVNSGGMSTAGYTIDNNTYYGSMLFDLNGSSMGGTSWMSASGFDAHSQFAPGAPTGVWTFIRPNGYESGRANIVIYNWDLQPEVSVDLTGILKTGDPFVLRDAENYFGTPIATGTWTDGVPLSIPMTGLTPAPTVGTTNAPPVHTAPQFGVFVVSNQ